MDQSKKDVQTLRELQVHLREATSLKKTIASSEERIRKGTMEEYVFCETETADEAERRKEKSASDNRAKADDKVKGLKISRICLKEIFPRSALLPFAKKRWQSLRTKFNWEIF